MIKTFIALTTLGIVTFALRVLGQLSQVFVDGNVMFRGQDAWYHLRLAAYLRENWPHLLRNDWFANPLGEPAVGWPPATTYVLGLPFLTEHQMEVWAAFVPPLVAVGVVVTVYFIGKELFDNRLYAFIGALLVAILPTELFHRTMLGFTDHHMFEVLFTSLSILFALKLQRGFQWSIPLGVSIGLLFLTWDGAAFIMATLTLGLFVQLFYNYLRNKDYFKLGMGFTFACLLAFLLFLPYVERSNSATVNMLSILIGYGGTGLFVALAGTVRNKLLFGLITMTVVGVAVVIAAATLPIVDIVSGIFGYGDSSVVSEMSPSTIWTLLSTFGLTLLLGLAGFILYLKERREYILPTFFVLTFLATIAHVRYGYYSVIPIVLFSTYLIQWVAGKIRMQVAVSFVMMVFIVMASLTNVVRLATYENDISPKMYEALTYLRTYSEDSYAPFKHSGSEFYQPLDRNADYLVLSLWDYNHWIIYAARRSPVTNAYGYEYGNIMQFFIDGRDPAPHIKKLYGRDIPIRYVIVDKNMLESNWLEWATGSPDYTYLKELWKGESRNWWTVYSNEEVRILQKLEKEVVPIER